MGKNEVGYKHTPGPWFASWVGGIRVNLFAGHQDPDIRFWIADVFGSGIENSKANASRIVACVNACEGMEDPAAEIAQLRAEIERLKRSNL